SHDADGSARAARRAQTDVMSAKPAVRRRDVLPSLSQPKVAVMLMLGFSSGLPFFLSGNTLGYWLRDAGTTLAAIGFLSWVGLAYSLKFLWAPIVDRVDAPLFGRLGRRRGWMMVSQIFVALGLTALSVIGLSAGLERARVLRRRDRPVHGILPDVRLARAADARDDQLLPAAGVRDGTDGEPVLSRPRPLEGRRWRGARIDRPGRIAGRHRRRRVQHTPVRLRQDVDRRPGHQDSAHL